MVRHFVLNFTGDTRAATAVEYGLLLGLLVIALVGALTAVGTSTSDQFNEVADGFPDA